MKWIIYPLRPNDVFMRRYAIIDSDNGLSSGLCQAIILINARILLNGPLRTNFGEILIECFILSFGKMRLKMLPEKMRPFCFGINELNHLDQPVIYVHAM